MVLVQHQLGFLIIINVMTHAKIFTVHQPGGSILVTSKRCHQLGYQTSIKGQVTTVATGKAYIE